MYTDYRMNDENVQDYQKHEEIINIVSKNFKKYGYKRIKTSTFEQYDLYSKVISSLEQSEMIKVIDRTGQVLVLRPDVTIPITRKLAQDFTRLQGELRYFYIQDVFRQSATDQIDSVESTQAGIEYFCESSPEADAEVLALAIYTLKDLGFKDVKIEMGHAGFFQEIIDILNLETAELSQLKNLIQAKNIVDIDPFLRNLSIKKEVREMVEKIPFLYGDPIEVSERAKKVTLTKRMDEKLDYLVQIYEILKMYGLEEHVVMDLGLINHMGYYSDVIFQGFIEEFGKPVLMGGRYNRLGNQFGAEIPAIGFACQVNSLIEATKDQEIVVHPTVDFKITYEESSISKSIEIANALRKKNYSVITLPKRKEFLDQQKATYPVVINEDLCTVISNSKEESFISVEELLKVIGKTKEDSDWNI